MNAAAKKNASRDKSILLAEDAEIVREMVQEILKNDGYEVFAYPDGQKAFAFFKENPEKFDLVVTDIVMPQMNGKELAQQCRGERPEVGILYMSGYLDSQLNTEEDLAGNTDFIAKPFRPAELLQKIEELIEQADTK